MKRTLGTFVLALAACTFASQALAQPWRGREGGPPPREQPVYRPGPPAGMSPEQRERLREDMRSARGGVYREQGPPPQYDPRRPPPRPMAPEERARLRRDIQDANRAFDRRR